MEHGARATEAQILSSEFVANRSPQHRLTRKECETVRTSSTFFPAHGV